MVGGGNGVQGVGGGYVEVVVMLVQQVGQWIFYLYLDQGWFGIDGVMDQGEMQIVGDLVVVGDQGEWVEFGVDWVFINVFDGFFGGQMVGDQVGDGVYFQVVFVGEYFQFWLVCYVFVWVEDFYQYVGWFQFGQYGQVYVGFGVVGVGEYVVWLGDQWEDVVWLVQVGWFGIGFYGCVDGVGVVVG